MSLKKELNWSAECIAGEICWDGFDPCETLSMECQRDLESKQFSNKDDKQFNWAFSTKNYRYNTVFYVTIFFYIAVYLIPF